MLLSQAKAKADASLTQAKAKADASLTAKAKADASLTQAKAKADASSTAKAKADASLSQAKAKADASSFYHTIHKIKQIFPYFQHYWKTGLNNTQLREQQSGGPSMLMEKEAWPSYSKHCPYLLLPSTTDRASKETSAQVFLSSTSL